MHKSAKVQAAVSSGRKIGQKLPRETNKQKKDGDKISRLLQTDNQGSNLEPTGKNTDVEATERVEMSIEIHLLFHTLHQLSANGERMTLKSQTEQIKG